MVVNLQPKIEIVEPKNEQEVHDGLDEEEGLENLEEEEETQPQILRRSTWKIRKQGMYNYSPSYFRYIFSLSTSIDEPITMKEVIKR